MKTHPGRGLGVPSTRNGFDDQLQQNRSTKTRPNQAGGRTSNTVKPEQEVQLDVYGCTFSLTGSGSGALQHLADDFRFFAGKGVKNPVSIELITGDPPYREVPAGIATTYTPRNVAFTHGDCTYIDYSGRALAIRDRQRESFRIYSRDLDIQYEAAYLFLLSRVGEYLDHHRMHRIHAMGVSVAGRAVLAVLPMGGGKSTLCLDLLLKYPEFSLLSDDSPFISRDGRINAFPLRLGLLPGNENDIPAEFRRTINRMEFGPKVLVNYEYFSDRVVPSADPGIVFLGKRTLSDDCRIEPVGAWEALKSMSINCVVGLGLYQGLEFVLHSSPLELLAKTGIAWSRLQNARRLFSRSRVHRLILGRDRERNAATVRDFVARTFDEG